MRVVQSGHLYELANADGARCQRIAFVRRRSDRGELLADEDRRPGILSQELLRVLIDRTLYLYGEDPCDEDTEIIRSLRRALVLYEARAARRSIEKLSKPEESDVCATCQHVLCFHGGR